MDAQGSEPSVWEMLYTQTPVALRAVLGFVTLGLFTLAGILYRWHRADIQAVHDRMDRLEKRLDTQFAELREHLLRRDAR